jgi:ketosteroid isomerase-like protein
MLLLLLFGLLAAPPQTNSPPQRLPQGKGLPHKPASSLPDDRFVRDLHDKDINDVLSLYSADAVFVQPDGTEVHGAAELRKLYEQVTASLDSDLSLQVNGVIILSPKLGIREIGNYRETLRHRDTGKVEEVHGTFKFAGHKEADGQWRFTRMEWH